MGRPRQRDKSSDVPPKMLDLLSTHPQDHRTNYRLLQSLSNIDCFLRPPSWLHVDPPQPNTTSPSETVLLPLRSRSPSSKVGLRRLSNQKKSRPDILSRAQHFFMQHAGSAVWEMLSSVTIPVQCTYDERREGLFFAYTHPQVLCLVCSSIQSLSDDSSLIMVELTAPLHRSIHRSLAYRWPACKPLRPSAHWSLVDLETSWAAKDVSASERSSIFSVLSSRSLPPISRPLSPAGPFKASEWASSQ